jgi:flagellar assembly protein FliH
MTGKPFNRVLTAENNNAASAWELPAVAGPAANRRYRPTLADMEEVERVAWDEAYKKGHAAGTLAGEAEFKKRLAELDQRLAQAVNLLDVLARPLEQLDADVEQQLVTLAFSISKHLTRRELKTDPVQVIALVRETVGLLPVSQRDVRVHLHPQDAALLRERLSEPQAERAWRIVEDPMMTRGGCRVSTDTAQIDARLETRLAAAYAHLMGDERSSSGREGAE